MKTFKTVWYLLLTCACVWAGLEGYKFMANTLTRSAVSESKKRVVVMGFLSETGDKSRASAIVTERLTSEIAANPRMEVIERSRLNEVLREQDLAAQGVLDPGTAKKIGNILGADAVVTGSVIELNGKEVEVNARLVDTQDARIIKAVTKKVSKDWEEKKVEKTGGWDAVGFDMNITLDAPIPLLPEGFMEDETCSRLTQEETALVHDSVELRARKTAWELKTGAMKIDQLTKNPGSELKDRGLKNMFYSKIKEWYYSRQLQPLTQNEEDSLERASPMIETYPCR